MIRERVGIDGVIRSMELEKDIQACCMHSNDIGLFKEGPVKRYLQGKAKWDKKYSEKKIKDRRTKNVKRAAKEESKRQQSRAKRLAKRAASKASGQNSQSIVTEEEEATASVEEEEQGTWAHIDGERPPPSSIAARRDTTDALEMAYSLKKYNKGSSKMNPIALWTGVHDLASVFPHRSDHIDGDVDSASSDEASFVDTPIETQAPADQEAWQSR